MADAHKNFAYSTVATAPSPASSGTSLVVAAADGAKFPAVPFNATVWPTASQPTTANAEIVRVTNISTDTFTITRTQESTSARTIVIGDQIAATITAKTLTDVERDQYANTYLTIADETIAAGTQVIYEDYLELAASFVYELAVDAILVIGDFSAPLPALDQYSNLYVAAADELVAPNSEVVFADYLELSAPFASELAPNAMMQLGTEVFRGGLLKLFSTTLTATAALDTGAAAIPSGYGHLYVVMIARSAVAGGTEAYTLRVNGDSAAIYDAAGGFSTAAGGATNGSNAGATAWTITGVLTGNTALAGYATTIILEFQFYDNTAWFKSGSLRMLTPDSATGNTREAHISLGYRSTAAINQITLDSVSHLLAGSSMTVYATG